MADIRKTQQYSLDEAEVRSRLEQLADEMSKKFGIASRWEGDVCHLSGSGVKSGKVEMSNNNVTIELNLGFAAKIFKGQIEKEIDARLEKLLA